MLKPTKKELKLLKQMARELPPTFYMANILKSGKELAEKFPNQKFELDKMYDYPVKYPTNHKNRIVKAYENGGMEAVKLYVKEVLDLIKKETEFKTTVAA